MASNYNSDALRALLVYDFSVLASDAHDTASVSDVSRVIVGTAASIVRDQLERWNARGPSYRLPPELLASCMERLPFVGRIKASSVSRFWRSTAVSFPAVWSTIHIDAAMAGADSLTELALGRSGAHPVDFRYTSSPLSKEPLAGIAICVEQHLGHMRSLVWKCIVQPPRMIHPAPILQQINIYSRWSISPQFLAGRAGRLQVVRLPSIDMPHTSPVNAAVSTVTTLAICMISNHHNAASFSRLFTNFPLLRSLCLVDVQPVHVQHLPDKALAASLVELAIESSSRDAGFELFAAWRAPSLKRVELLVPSPISEHLACALNGCTELQLDSTNVIVARDSAGCSLAIGDKSVMPDTLQPHWATALLGLTSERAPSPLIDLRAIYMDIVVFADAIVLAHALPRLTDLTLYLHSRTLYRPFGPARRRGIDLRPDPWKSLSCLRDIRDRLPALTTVVLDMHHARGTSRANPEIEAHRLAFELKGIRPKFSNPVLRVRGLTLAAEIEIVANSVAGFVLSFEM